MITISNERLERIEQKLSIMNAAVTALLHRVEEYNPKDEIAQGAAWSVIELKEEVKALRD